MVAQIGGETFTHSSHAPEPDPADSDDILLALETARALEAQGDLRDAARWLRRAAEQAEEQGNDERVLVFARAAADLTNTIRPEPEPPLRPASAAAPASARVSSPPPVPARIPTPSPRPAPAPISSRAVSSGVSPATPPRVSGPPPSPRVMSSPSNVPARTAPPPRKSPQAPPSPASLRVAARPPSTPEDEPVTEPTLPVTTMRVAIPASTQNVSVFVVRKLETGQALPAGTTEAMLVLTAES